VKKVLERVGGTGPMQGVALRLVMEQYGGLEVAMVAGDRAALEAFVTALGIPLPLPAESVLDVLLVEKDKTIIKYIDNGEGLQGPTSGMTH
jgi:hypothetical protein